MKNLISTEKIQSSIYAVRGVRVMLDSDLAEIYGVKIWRLNEQVKRNESRFPDDFMFQFTKGEYESLRSQIAILKKSVRGGHRKYMPRVFTEHGAVMLASVLNTPVAVKASIQVVRAFIEMCQFVLQHRTLYRKLAELEKKLGKHDGQIGVLFDAMRQMIVGEKKKNSKRIGY